MTWNVTNNELTEEQLLVNESLFSLGNGFLGVRGNVEEGYGPDMTSIRGTYINAYHDETEIEYGEKLYAFPETQQKLVNIIDSQTVTIDIDGERFSMFSGKILGLERVLHMDRGIQERRVHWRSPKGKEVKLTFRRLVSFTRKELFAQEITIDPSTPAEVHVAASVNGNVSNFVDPNDPRVASGHAERLHVTAQEAGEVLHVTNQTYETKLNVHCASCSLLEGAEADKEVIEEEGKLTETYSFQADGPVVLTRWNAYTDTYRHENRLKEKAEEVLAGRPAFSLLEKEQKEYLDHFWMQANLKVGGDESLQQGIHFNLYHLLQSAGRDAVSNIPAKGLSGEGYEGHYFWDTEIYMFPVFLMTQPEIAKQLLKYRHSLLDAARARAKEVGHSQGALFPWRTITGGECSAYFPAGTAQYHISADISYSFIQYYLVTGDEDFLRDYMLEVLTETSRLWMDMGHEKNGMFRLDDVTGPDEYTCIVNNNYYTNVMAKHSLRWAVKAWQKLPEGDRRVWAEKLDLKESEMKQWEKAAKNMYLPYSNELGIQAQDDTFLNKKVWDLENTPKEKFPLLLHYHPLTLYRYQVCKQADTVLGHFLLEDEADEETMRRSYDYYEKVTTHDSSLSYCVFSMMAARLGRGDKAYRYFIETARLDIDNTHKNTKDGLHLANMGGTWLALVFGFAGMRVKEKGLVFRPVLPKEWDTLSFRIQYQGRLLEVTLNRKEAVYQLLEGKTLHFTHRNESVTVTASRPVKLAI
ncbi:glycoside hydrolase family 65 protein [Alkalicoccus halolimnae]|uniref:Glycosyl hydrolase family 65 protein n=1 Tax=Alkalicoccus halolimnae TaxID=1667239 RepID=A0A5C7FIM1_9BACI|nr:glycosyl hydrolase family 65 protein [Alkalicoccus halolimnae]TXF84012.1 glycoside hydrolase family 65 protein [Alkalicoccus halolimnae]